MKVNPLKIMESYNFMNDVKHTFNSLDKESTNTTKIIYNMYTRHIMLYVRCVLRYINATLTNSKN